MAREQPPPLDLGESAQAFELELFDRTLELGEVTFEPRVGQLGQLLVSERIDRGTDRADLGSSGIGRRCLEREHGFDATRLRAQGP